MKILVIGVTSLASLALAGCAASGSTESSSPSATAEPRFLTALHDCQLLTSTGGVEYADEGHTLILNTVGNDTAQDLLPVRDVECVLRKLDATTATMNLIESTRALDGRQTATWNDVDAAWTYHPDNGLNLTLQDMHD